MLQKRRKQIQKGDARLRTHFPDESLRALLVLAETVYDGIARETLLQKWNICFRVNLKWRRDHADEQLAAPVVNLLLHLSNYCAGKRNACLKNFIPIPGIQNSRHSGHARCHSQLTEE